MKMQIERKKQVEPMLTEVKRGDSRAEKTELRNVRL